MNDEQKLYGLMAIAEQQQKTLDATLKEVQATSQALAQERALLARTVKSISQAVGDSASQSLLNALGDAQRRFSDEMSQNTGEALKSAQSANQELQKAKKTVTEFCDDLKGAVTNEIQKTMLIIVLISAVLGIASLGGLYGYFVYKAAEKQELAEFWQDRANAAYEKCQKLKNCRS